MKYIKEYFEYREIGKRNLCNFSDNEFETIEDIFLFYINEHSIIEMILDDDGYRVFDITRPSTIQYRVEKFRNISLEIFIPIISSYPIYMDLIQNLKSRLSKYGFNLFSNSKTYYKNFENTEVEGYLISIVVTKS